MRWLCTSLALLVLTLPLPAAAQETSGSFTDGSIRIGYDNRTCDSTLEGSLRYNSSGGSCPIDFCALGSAPTSGLIGHWKLDESGNTSTAADSAGPTFSSGTLENFPADPSASWQLSGGQIDGALLFDGINDRIDYPNDADLMPTDEFTIAAWVNPNNVGSGEGPAIAKAARSDGFGDGWRMGLLNGERFQISVWTDVGSAWHVDTPQFTINTGQWYHVVATYDGSEVKIYVDGVDSTEDAPFLLTGAVTYPNGAEVGSIGHSNGVPYWDGLMDEVRLYNRALTTQEVEDLYNSSSFAWQPWCAGN